MADDHGDSGGGSDILGNFVDWLISGSHGHGDGEHAKDFHHYVHEIGHWGISRALFLWTLCIGELFVLSNQVPSFGIFSLTWLAATLPIWLPAALLVAGWNVWILYIQSLFLSGRDPVLLEIKLPREVMKSPRAMELVLTNLYNTSGESEFYNRAWKGQVRMWFSLELVSLGGTLHFYIWTWGQHKATIEAAIYAQYPDVEIYPVEDYATKVHYDPAHYECFTMNYKLAEKDALPIKTYIEFELDKDPKEEFKIDPLAQVLETLAAIKPHEQIWVQIVCRANGQTGVLKRVGSDWKKQVAEYVQGIRKEAQQPPDPTAKDAFKFPNPTWRQIEQIKAIERAASKPPFDVGGRAIYLADLRSGSFNGLMIGRLINLWRPMSAPQFLNSFGASAGHLTFEYPWQDFRGLRKQIVSRRMIDAYRRRSYFYPPWITPHSIMTTESLATLWHFPSSGIQTPGLERIPATKSEAPLNLPM